MIEDEPREAQDAFWPVDYARWRIVDLRHDPKTVRIGDLFTGLIITVRDIALALPEENLEAFAREHAAHTRCANLLDVDEPTEDLLCYSAALYLRDFLAWRRERAVAH